MSTSFEPDIVINISKGDLTQLHKGQQDTDNKDEVGDDGALPTQTANDVKSALSNILNDNTYNGDDLSESGNALAVDNDEDCPLNIKVSKNETIEYHTEPPPDHDENYTMHHRDTLQWFRMGTDRSVTPNITGSDTPATSTHDLRITQEEQWEEFVLHLRHVASYKAEYDIYQILAYRAMISYGQRIYLKPFKALKGMISDEWSNLEIRWLNSFQRVLSQAIICFCIQTLGVTVILSTQFTSYFAEDAERSQCDYHYTRWSTEWHLKILAFLWTAFIALGVSGWVYRARHSGFYPVLLFLRPNQYPPFVSTTILQIGLLTNYYVVTSSVIGSFILIYQTEGGTETIGMILQAVALFFILELDNRIVHGRDFLSIKKYFDGYIKSGKHKKIPHSVLEEEQHNCVNKPRKHCRGNTCLSGILSIVTFVLLVMMTVGGLIAPWLIMICW